MRKIERGKFRMVDDENKEVINIVEEDEDEKGSGFMVSPNFGLLIKHYRRAMGYSLKELEDRSGVSSGYISRLENQRRNPSITKILQIAGALNIPNDVLVATIIKNDDEERRKESITDVLIKNDYLINEGPLTNYAKEILIRIVESIAEAEWSQRSKVRELYEISELIDQLKETM